MNLNGINGVENNIVGLLERTLNNFVSEIKADPEMKDVPAEAIAAELRKGMERFVQQTTEDIIAAYIEAIKGG